MVGPDFSQERDLASLDLPPVCNSVPSMMSLNERKLLYWLASTKFSGWGHIVDAGTFLGASTLAFGTAVLKRPELREAEIAKTSKAKVIQSYDRCIVGPAMLRLFNRQGHPLATTLRNHDDFSAVLDKFVAGVKPAVDMHVGDFLDFDWMEGSPIEILFVDIAKTAALNAHLVNSYFPALRKGSYVIQQDFFFDELPWIKTSMGYLKDHFELIGEVNSSALFKCTNADWQDKCKTDPWSDASTEELEAMHAQWLASTKDPRRRLFMQLSHVRLLAERGKFADADSMLTAVEKENQEVIATNSGYIPTTTKLESTRRFIRNRQKPESHKAAH